ncbi:hypothetical protein RRU94_18440 [Domibacillus sp. DTU_2020_1001157_1_SI_ALB_TIR_016]|uniref:DUF7010 family protein n=1 Tax=Domibacillus sp. DTU_2020_1001157_1_SI_ALB_TIR_016 TaxID=3077789 RepID=UPI0028E7C655|nr:hypothetical protein [Domibacillus sp. DTU_2020_1001157_1_SI_ALB_TIR_016]WNS79508.1 hypothetical protein RRU94_18440 [Domibacillus sp. DTU_2020_1001157_1_SI_ALB_TIR_016]
MNYLNKTLEQFQTDMILAAKKGFPILLSGSIIFLLFTFLPFVLPLKPVCLIWILGMSAIFPFGLVLCKMMNVHLLSTDNPLSVLGGMIAAAQAFFIPVFILVYRHMPEYLPFTIGLLGGSHFLPYMWIYRSKAYLFITLGTCSSALVLGGYFVEQAFTLVPLATSIVYAIGILLIFKELKTDAV